LVTSAGPMFFGTYYRLKLRQLALKRLGVSEVEIETNRRLHPLESLWLEYAELVNML